MPILSFIIHLLSGAMLLLFLANCLFWALFEQAGSLRSQGRPPRAQ